MSDNTGKTGDKYDHVNPLIVKYILGQARQNPTILDVGCWRGALGAVVRQQVDCTIDGLDNSPEMAVAKDKGYQHLYKIDLNTKLDLSPVTETYDIIVLGDVLEHTMRPQEIVEGLKLKLKKNGLIIISLPNVGFVLYRLTHLLGRWRYTEKGVMDETHLRFFTKSTMDRFMQEAGLEVLHAEGLSVVQKKYAFLNTLAKIMPGLFGLQVVYLTRPKR